MSLSPTRAGFDSPARKFFAAFITSALKFRRIWHAQSVAQDDA